MARHQYGSQKMTGTPEREAVKLRGKAPQITASIRDSQGKVDDGTLRKLMGQVGGSHDLMVFNATKRVVYIQRTQAKPTLPWQRFKLEERPTPAAGQARFLVKAQWV
jgi:hypothetical protein